MTCLIGCCLFYRCCYDLFDWALLPPDNSDTVSGKSLIGVYPFGQFGVDDAELVYPSCCGVENRESGLVPPFMCHVYKIFRPPCTSQRFLPFGNHFFL